MWSASPAGGATPDSFISYNGYVIFLYPYQIIIVLFYKSENYKEKLIDYIVTSKSSCFF
jgi:hypothetical protein